ncbi:MAG TPA: HD domain-containing phosphohydrolase [Noviherbaspirillum sp.]
MESTDDSVDVALFDMVLSLSRAIDLLHPAICEHHLRVAYASGCIGEALGLSADAVQDLVVAGALHDIAAVCAPSSRSLLDRALRYYGGDNSDFEDVHAHARDGNLILRDFPPFAQAAAAIRFHHVDWCDGSGAWRRGEQVPLASHILRIADRLAVLPCDGRPILSQKYAIQQAVREGRGSLFVPALVDAFEAVSARDVFWLDLVGKHKESTLRRRFGGTAIRLDLDGLYALAKMFARIIDYRSSFTALHSSRVAEASELLATRLELPANGVRLIGVAGYLHDIGKLSIPTALLDKPGRLTDEEMLLIRQHPYYTREILCPVPGLETVSMWASYHHERLDGAGYPFRPQHLPTEARIVAVADVYTALTEDRPYRRGMEKADCFRVLDGMVSGGALDGDIVALLRTAYDALPDDRGNTGGELAGRALHA